MMTNSAYGTELTLTTGSVVAGGFDNRERFFTWPTELDEHSVVRALDDIVLSDEMTATWPKEVIANQDVSSVRSFIEGKKTILENNSGIVRFNAGNYPHGFSVTALINDNVRTLEGTFNPDSDELAMRVIESTIVTSGIDRVYEIVQLGRVIQP